MTLGTEIRFIVRSSTAAAGSLVPIPGPQRLVLDGSSKLIALPVDSTPDAAYEICVVEPIHRSQRSLELVVLWSCNLSRPLVNGFPALPVSVLRTKDEVAWPGLNMLIHVTEFLANPIGPLQPAETGSTCALCRTELTPPTLVWRCACGARLCAPKALLQRTPEDISCATLTPDCPACSRPIQLTGGYEYWPEDIDETN